MDDTQLRRVVLDTLAGIAPELDPAILQGDRLLRLQVDLDSFDWLSFLVSLKEQLKVDIPESDYARLDTLDHLIAYLRKALG